MSGDVESFLAARPEPVRRIAEALRGTIRTLAPEAVEQLHGGWKVIGYSRDGSIRTSICAIAPHGRHVNLQFSRGTDLPDPAGMLDGTGKRARHVKLRSAKDVHASSVAALIREARDLAGSAGP